MATPLKTSLLEAVVILQGLLALLKAGQYLIFFPRFMFLDIGNIEFLINQPLFTLLWTLLLLTIITQLRLSYRRITTPQTLYFELTKSGIITFLAIWFVVDYLIVVSNGMVKPGPPYYFGAGVFWRVYSTVLFLVFNFGLFYPTLWFAWKETREGGITLGERAESRLPQ